MPLSSFAVDALGVVTICLVAILVLLGLFCIIYTLYFSARVRSSGFVRFGYFNGPWLVRIAFVVFGICWGTGEVVRLTFFRQQGRIFHSLDEQWQENLCKLYILSNLGFTEPCLFLIMSFLLHASLKWRGSGILNHKWNMKTTGYVLLYCLPIFISDLIIVMVSPKFRHGRINILRNVPKKFTSSYLPLTVSGKTVIACTFPMLCTMVHGLFTAILTSCLLLLGRQVAMSVINKGLQKRVYILIFLVSSLLPLRVLLLGFSVFAWQEHFIFETLAFLGFLVLLSCVVMGIYMLVYLPMADSLALNWGLGFQGVEREGRVSGTSFDDHTESLCLMAAAASANQGIVETSTARTSLERNSDVSTKQSSISFQTLIKDEASSTGVYEEEMSLAPFSPSFRVLSSSPGCSVAARMILT